jgi:uncharacterized protein (DUF1778 family)
MIYRPRPNKRPHQVNLRLSDDEKHVLIRAAKLDERTMSDYIRKAAIAFATHQIDTTVIPELRENVDEPRYIDPLPNGDRDDSSN